MVNNIKRAAQDVIDALDKADEDRRQVVAQLLSQESDIIRMAREACDPDKVDAFHNGFWVMTSPELERFAAFVRADERELCALICDSVNSYDNPMTANDVADAIRARGETK